ncbi:MAG: TylF/MycF/NovP-related O-methyltransferase [bacterium]
MQTQEEDSSRLTTQQLIDAVRNKNLTYLKPARLRVLADICDELERNNEAGDIIEAGCALGGSAILITHIKNQRRKLRVYDVFSMIPPPGDKDGEDVKARYAVIKSGKSKGIKGGTYYGYVKELKRKVIDSFSEFGLPVSKYNVELVEGMIQDTLDVNAPICLAHIDVDWYDPVYTCLSRIEPELIINGYIVVDDYNDWSGCHTAVDDYFRDKKRRFSFDASRGSLVIKKLTDGQAS